MITLEFNCSKCGRLLVESAFMPAMDIRVRCYACGAPYVFSVYEESPVPSPQPPVTTPVKP